MNEFLLRCLEGVPKGGYQNRTEKELQDHLLTMNQELEGSGYSPTEAHTLAQEHMGDPAELAWRYAQEWRRRAGKVLATFLAAAPLGRGMRPHKTSISFYKELA